MASQQKGSPVRSDGAALYLGGWSLKHEEFPAGAGVPKPGGIVERGANKTGRSALFQALKPHLAGDPGALPYQAIALSMGATLTGIKVTVHRSRRRFQEILRAEVTPLVANAAEVEDEIRHLLRVLS